MRRDERFSVIKQRGVDDFFGVSKNPVISSFSSSSKHNFLWVYESNSLEIKLTSDQKLNMSIIGSYN